MSVSKYLRKNPIRHGMMKYKTEIKKPMYFVVLFSVIAIVSLWHSKMDPYNFLLDFLFMVEISLPMTLIVATIENNWLCFEQLPEHGTHNVKNIGYGEELFAVYAISSFFPYILSKMGFSFWTCTHVFTAVGVVISNYCLEQIAYWPQKPAYEYADNLISRKGYMIGNVNRFNNKKFEIEKQLDSIVDSICKPGGVGLMYLSEMPREKRKEAEKILEDVWKNAEENPTTWKLKNTYF